MLLWIAFWLGGVEDQSGGLAYQCGDQIGELYGAPDSVVRHRWFWDCLDPSGALVFRTWLPLIGRGVAYVPSGLFVGVVLYAARWRRRSPVQSPPIRELLRLVTWIGAGVAAVVVLVDGLPLTGPNDSFWWRTTNSILLTGGWIGWARTLRHALGPNSTVVASSEVSHPDMTVE